MKKNYFLSLIFLASSIFSFSQTKEDAAKIVEKYDIKKIKERKEFHLKNDGLAKKNAIEKAKINNWPLTVKKEDGGFMELMKLTPDGFPIYYATDNANAAKSTRANQLNTGGSLGLTLNGEGMVARVWDGGTVRRTHNLFSGRVTTVDDPAGTTYIAHGTHVTGTIMASNAVAATKGMAWMATARTFDWTNDLSEVYDEVLGGMLISNHSYGVPIVNGSGVALPSYYIGAYIDDTREWDEAAYLSPYYLMVASAGNNGLDNNNTDPMAIGYDKLTGNKVCKNNLVVANAQDASVDASGNLTAAVLINGSSSQGPSDDRRIKPDITGNGTNLTSTGSTSNTATLVLSGTSMASPNVAGTLLLLQQYYKNLTNNFMRAATLKGLACHTADDAGNIGPDAVFGWGLLNAKKAAVALRDNGLTSWVSEEVLNQGQTYTMNVKSDGVNPLMASITWADLPGVVDNSNPVNDLTPKLINDLDIRITKTSTTYFPWKLDSDVTLDAIRTGDNNVDNVEQVKIDAPVAGDYTITITHKGTLQGGTKQNYSLVVTGITSGFSINSTSSDLTVCSNQTAAYTFAYKQTGVGTTTFSAIGLPVGASASFSPASLNANGTVTMTVSGLATVLPGEYNVGILGNNGLETESRYRILRVYNATLLPTTLNTPNNGQTGVSTTVTLKWNKDVNAENYAVQVATDSNFTNIVTNTTVTENSLQLSGLNQETYYYWRVTPSNRCGNGLQASSAVRIFQTGVLLCGFNFTATDYSNATIAATANASANIPVTVTGGYTIGDLNVNLNITHTYIQDMTISLQGPAAIGSPVIYLFQEACGDNDNINCVVDDAGSAPACSGVPAISGNVTPSQPLSELNGLVADGIWTLHVVDPYTGDGGVVNSFGLSICKISPSLGINENDFAEVKIYPNPTKGNVNITLGDVLEGETSLSFYDIQGRQILTKKMTSSTETLNIDNFQDGVYLLSIENGNKKMTKKIVLSK